MKIINRELGGGKTVALVELMLAPGNKDVYYVAPTYAQAQLAYREAKARNAGVDRRRFLSASALNAFHEPNPRFVIDELEGVIDYLVKGRVLAVAGTDEDLREGQMRRIRGER